MNNSFQKKVSVCIVTYNQERYISQCLQSVIGQKTNFEFEIIISDDCSTDSTPEIIRYFSTKNANIKSILREKNVGALENFISTHNLARGKYICHLDGDDYWLQGKLQAQADILDNNNEISFATHAMKIINEHGDILTNYKKNIPQFGTVENLISLGTYFSNSSIMYRINREYNHKNTDELIDYYLHIERATKGYIYFDKTFYGVYRDHAEGISKSNDLRDKLEHCYEAAFDRAIELGVNKSLVERGRMKRRLSFALSRLAIDDVDGYIKLIDVNLQNIKYSTIKHIILSITKKSNLIRKLIISYKIRRENKTSPQ